MFAPADAGTTDADRRLALLYELPLKLGQEGRLDVLLQTIVEQMVAIIPGAARGALLVKEPRTGNLLLKAHQLAGEPAVSMTLARRAVEERQGFVWQSRRNESEHLAAGHRLGHVCPAAVEGRSAGRNVRG